MRLMTAVFCVLGLLAAPTGCGRQPVGPSGAPPSSPSASSESGADARGEPARKQVLALPGRPASPGKRAAGAPLFEDVTQAAGIVHRHKKAKVDPKVLRLEPWVTSLGAAVALADVEGDGDLDIYATTSLTSLPNALYLNQLAEGAPGLRFVEAAREAGVADLNDRDETCSDAVFGDLDNDGDPDLYVVRWGENRLYRNNGKGRFTEVTAEAGVGDAGYGTGAIVFDYDNDGLLDIFVCNYFPPVRLANLETTRLETTRVLPDDLEQARNGGPNALYHNEGDLRFSEVAGKCGVAGSDWSLDAGIADIDNDGDSDLYVANDFGPDRLFFNTPDGTFVDGTEARLGLRGRKSTSVDFGDIDGDGWLDIHVSGVFAAKYFHEGSRLWRNGGDDTGLDSFLDVAALVGVNDAGWGWCGRFLDHDLDGDLDLLVANGCLSSGATSYWDPWLRAARSPSFEPADITTWPPMGSHSLSGGETTRLFSNAVFGKPGDGSFSDRAREEGIAARLDSRGIALGDLDLDGDLDVVMASQNHSLRLYRSAASPSGHWMTARLRGTRSSRDALGARLELVAGDLRMVREVNGVNGFASQSDLAVHFGLGSRERVDTLNIFWPSGVVTSLQGLAADHHYVIEESGDVLPMAERAPRYLARQHLARRGSSGDPPLESLLDGESRIWASPLNARFANRYRELARSLDAHDRSIRFFRDLRLRYAPREAPLMVKLQLALSYIDKIPAVEKDVLLRASFAKESLLILDRILAKDPQCYAARFICGMNHLYWPASLKHAPDALEHLQHCKEALESPRPSGEGGQGVPREDPAHWLEVAMALGDAHVKAKDFAKARQLWREALEKSPEEARLLQRMSSQVEPLMDLVREKRGLDRPIDTGLAFLEKYDETGETGTESGTDALAVELDSMERSLRQEFDVGLCNRYRDRIRSGPDRERGARFLEELLNREAASPCLRVQMVLALLDRLPDPRLGTFGRGRVAARAVEEADKLAPAEARPWSLQLLLGSIHLNQHPDLGEVFLAIRHLDQAVKMLEKSTGSEAPSPGDSSEDSGPLRPAEAYCALGDALVKASRFIEGRKVWKKGLERYPEDPGLLERMGCTSLMVNDYVARTRSWKVGLDTDAFAAALCTQFP